MRQRFSPIDELKGQFWQHMRPIIFESLDNISCIGSALLISPYHAITAAHVVREYASGVGLEIDGSQSEARIQGSLYLLDARNEGTQSRDHVAKAIFFSRKQDLCLLTLRENSNLPNYPLLDFRPPRVSERLFGIGFPNTLLSTIAGSNGIMGLGVDPTVTDGYVIDVHPERFSAVERPFPGVTVAFRSEGGMSGGPVFSILTGRAIGIISSGLNTADQYGMYQSNVATLAPLLLCEVLFDGSMVALKDYLANIGCTPTHAEDYTTDDGADHLSYHGPSLDLPNSASS